MARVYTCPYWRWDRAKELQLSCEGACLRFYRAEAREAYIDRYCAGDWRRCTVAAALLRYYERTEK